MLKSIIHTTENNNSYIYDDQHRLSMLIHPDFIKANDNIMDADPYYFEKKNYLQSYGLFTNSKLVDFAYLDEYMVNEDFIETKQIVFEVTDSCNLNCAYCAFGDLYEVFDERVIKNINNQYAINLLKYLFNLKPKNKKDKVYISFYGGEPLLNFNFIKQVVDITNKIKSEKEINIGYSMTTNATLINKHIKFLVENNFKLLISLDGDEDNHSYRSFKKNNENSFQIVINNIDIIKNDYPEYFKEHISFNAVLHDKNSVKEIYEFIYKRYRKIPRISELNRENIKPAKEDLFLNMFNSKRKSENEYQKINSEMLNITHNSTLLYKELTDFLKYFSINYYMSNIPVLLNLNEIFLPSNTCLPFSKKIFLTSRNKLLPCEKINYKFFMGQVNEEVIINIPEITKQMNFYYSHLKKECQKCYVYKFCGVCLFRLKNFEKLGTEDFFCDSFHDHKSFIHKLNRIFAFLEKYPNDFFQILENLIIA